MKNIKMINQMTTEDYNKTVLKNDLQLHLEGGFVSNVLFLKNKTNTEV